jgi:hypothetical protein
MSLAPKISITNVDKIYAQTVTLKDTTGAYDAGTNPGGYGGPNYDTDDLDWALIYLRNYDDEGYSIQKLSDLTAILGSGQNFAGISGGGKFKDGIWEVKYYPVVAHPVTPGVDTAITWVPGTKTFTVASANTLLTGAIGILVKDVSDIKIYFLDPNVPLTSTTATVTELLPGAGTGLLAIVYQADARFLMPAAADDCLAKTTDKVLWDCTCFSPQMQELYLRMGKRQGADIHLSQGNYQAAHELITQLAAYCNNTSKCCC